MPVLATGAMFIAILTLRLSALPNICSKGSRLSSLIPPGRTALSMAGSWVSRTSIDVYGSAGNYAKQWE
jgi:hypothetical protein